MFSLGIPRASSVKTLLTYRQLKRRHVSAQAVFLKHGTIIDVMTLSRNMSPL
jgi:hypothetical protein